MLVEAYIEMMKKGVDDPKLLKEVRELLKDNDITGDIAEMMNTIQEQEVELPEDWAIEG
jgi:urease gamma subunit